MLKKCMYAHIVSFLWVDQLPHNGSGFLRHNAKYLDVKLLFELLQGPLDHKPEEKIAGNALFRWQSNVDDPHTFMDLFVSNADPVLQMRSCAYNPRYGFGAFGILPLLLKKRVTAEDYGVMGLRYGSEKLSAGVTVMPFAVKDELPKSAWLVSKMGRLTVGVQYEPRRVYDHQSSCDLERALARYSWRFQVARLLDALEKGLVKPSIQQIQRHLKEEVVILLGAETLRGLHPVETISIVGKICAEINSLYVLLICTAESFDICSSNFGDLWHCCPLTDCL